MTDIADRIADMAARLEAHSQRRMFLQSRVTGILLALMIAQSEAGNRERSQYLIDLVLDIYDSGAQEAEDIAEMTQLISDLLSRRYIDG
jgi:hypothetical protein